MINGTYNGHPVHLIESLDELSFIKSLLTKQVNVGLDTETQGLDYNNHRVVGVCLSCGTSYAPKDYHGFYLPIRHVGYSNNLSIKDTIAFTQEIIDNYKTCWWNRSFDATMLEFDGIKFPCVGHTYDSQIMYHLAMSESLPALKDSAHNLLHYDVIDFSSNKADEGNFGSTDPRVSYVYAAQDPIVTTLLARKVWNDYPYIRKIFPLDNKVADVVRRLCLTTELPLNHIVTKRELEEVVNEITSVKSQIFALTGYQFQLDSNKDKIDALSRFVTLTQKTSKGQFKVDKETLARIDHPLAKLLVKYNLLKTHMSFVKKIHEYGDSIRINYSTVNVVTGRFSSGSAKGNPYFANLNIQNIPKKPLTRYVHPDPLLGYIMDDDPTNAIGTMEAKGGLRDAFVPPEGFVWMCSDYGQQELRCIGNFSGEVNLIQPILDGKDIHTYVAEKMFGYCDKHHRTKVKTLNFAVAYGANEFTIARKLDIPVDEAAVLLDNYYTTMAQFSRWKAEMERSARRSGFSFTYFGRPRLLYKYYNSSDRSLQAFADRTAVNSPVQGTGGDLIRIDHVKFYEKLATDPEFAENVRYASTVHDEINLFVKPTYIRKAFEWLRDMMFFHPSNFRVPIEAEPAVGTCWGTLVETNYINDNNHIIINRKKLDPMGGKTVEEMNEWLDNYEATL